ncbi:hypothetical protein K458DRAFT_492897 [Lentithecium fluviatile CBS 122367]|uniref:Mid2 domain-containing protein n=1 Tax=Lentithecium fluviatile CBS 122367 TaxID=1168545 RepID=A0A6G1ICM8_9PLEO|nr:hypothetical protein K458DRAFT_492897 [Lentithecium fluviatile CBS 122367]
MARHGFLLTALLFSAAHAAYDKFFFTTNDTGFMCPDMSIKCEPGSVCAHDNLLKKTVCCDSYAEDAVCWSGSSDCGGGMLECASGVNAYCCLADSEKCTQHSGQINICWMTSENPVANFEAKLDAAFTSLSSASPSATYLTVDIKAITASSTPTPTTTSSTTSSPGSTPSGSLTTSSTGSSAPTQESGGGMSGGAIGGTVAGVVVGLAVIGAGLFYLFRRRRAANEGVKNELDGNEYLGAYAPVQKYAHEALVSLPAPVEMPGSEEPRELEGNQPVRRG